MSLEPSLLALGGLLVGIVVAAMVGGLIGRRIRVWRERRDERRATAAVPTTSMNRVRLTATSADGGTASASRQVTVGP